MTIKGKALCFFEQSGTFKNEFIRLGIKAEDYDIQNNFDETDHVVDLFREIDVAYEGGASMFDSITPDDFIIAFYPCIYFSQMSQYAQSLNYINYRNLTEVQACDKIIARQEKRHEYLVRLTKFVRVCLAKKIRMVFENPLTGSFLASYFLKPPTIKDMNRMKRGDCYVKPTGYWFWNCEPTNGCTLQMDKEKKLQQKAESRWTQKAGTCSEERSMIHPDYARNFIKDFILGLSVQKGTQQDLFEPSSRGCGEARPQHQTTCDYAETCAGGGLASSSENERR